ncbi:MAG TPA: cytochrome c-type biogenesis CcmF C-terminal domain-containing protein, partial [Candidatus Saccharimonadales bacterium]|nr:cytochrome c-type biogenesis CcmF C-terminal domain-containing protein [Candidatus Saccharimonadales bacterium]
AEAWRRFQWPLVLAAASTLVLGVWRVHQPLWLLLSGAATFMFFTNLWAYLSRPRRDPARAGAYLAHVGFALVLVGAVVSNGYSQSDKLELSQDRPASAFGYQMTYRGLRPTADGKQMAVIDVSRGPERFAAQPRIYFSPYNQGVMRKPAIHRYPGYDLYIAPIEELNPAVVSASTELREHEIQDVGRYRVRFDGLRMDNGEGMLRGEPGAVYADLTLTDAQGAEHRVSPGLRVSGGQQSHPGDLPGGLGRVELLGMQVSEQKVRLGFRAAGMPPVVEVARGEVRNLGAATVQFTGFRVPDPQGMQQGRGTVFADLEVTPRGGRPAAVAPSVTVGAPTEEVVAAKLPGGAGEVKVADLQAEKTTVKLDWSGVPGAGQVPPSLAVEVTIKPLIFLFWLGTLLVSAGFLVTLLRRAGEWRAAGATS